MRWTLLSCLVTTLILACACKGEFQANTHTTYDQKNASIAMDWEGDFIVVWSSYLQDGSSNGIFGQRFDPNCEPLGGEFQINTTTSGNQTEPSVGMDAAGNFVVVWHGPGISEEDILAQRFDPNGQPVGDEFQVNSYTDGKQRYPKVAMNTAGAFAVVWESEKVVADQTVRIICCQLYDPNGTEVGDEFQVNLEADARYPDAAMDDAGSFAVVWMQDNGGRSVVARLYGADGVAKANPFQVNTVEFTSLTEPTIAMNASGRFVITWDGHPERASLDDIHFRLYMPSGAPREPQFTINTTQDGAQQNPSIAINNQDEFVIVWNSETDPNSNSRDIFGQRYDSSCKPVGGEFQINTHVEHDQRYPDVAITETGECVAVWQSDEQDGSRYGIFGQMMAAVGSADFTGDGLVNFQDFCILAEEWRTTEHAVRADLIEDNKINAQDLTAFCQQWLTHCN